MKHFVHTTLTLGIIAACLLLLLPAGAQNEPALETLNLRVPSSFLQYAERPPGDSEGHPPGWQR